MQEPTQSPKTQELTPEQQEGLAFMGSLGYNLKHLIAAPDHNLLDKSLNTAGGWFAEYDLPVLIQETLATLSSLQKSGMLTLLRNNSDFLMDSLQTVNSQLQSVIAILTEDNHVGELMVEIRQLRGLLTKVSSLDAFLTSEQGRLMTGQFSQLIAELQTTGIQEAIPDLLETLAQLSSNGSLRRLREAGDWLNGLLPGIELSTLVTESRIDEVANVINRVKDLLHSFNQALADAHLDEDQLGGVGGLVHLLRDREVQVGLRALTVLPVYLERLNEAEGSSATKK